MRLKSRRGSNQYQQKLEPVDFKRCYECKKNYFPQYDFSTGHPMRKTLKNCPDCGNELKD